MLALSSKMFYVCLMKNLYNENFDAQGAGEVIDLETYTKSGTSVPVGKRYKVRIDNEYFIFDHHIITGAEILEKVGKKHVECHTVYQKFKDCDFEKIDLKEKVNLSKPGIENFVIKQPETFHYTVDGEPETTDEKVLTPNQILELAGVTPVDDYYLVQKNPDGSDNSYKGRSTDSIKMQCPAMKFISVFNGEMPVS